MRARLAAPRRRTTARSRLIVPVAAAAAVALVGGAVVATDNSPISRDQVQTVALTVPTATVGAAFSFNVKDLAAQAGFAGAVVTGIEGLPAGVTYDAATGVVSGVATTSGVYAVKVHASIAGQNVTVPVSVTVNNADGTAPAGGLGGGSAAGVQGSLGGNAQAGGQVSTGSSGIDGLVGAVSGLFEALSGGTGSTGGVNGGGTATATATAPAPSGTIQGGSTGGLPGSSGNAETGGRIEIPGSSANAGSLGQLAPGLAISGAALLGLAGLSLLLNGGSSTPGSAATIPGLGGSLGGGGSAGRAPATATVVTAPGPTVANGRG